MTDVANLRELLSRVEGAEGPSRELDWGIAEIFGLIPEHSVREIGFDYNWFRTKGEYSLWKANDSEGRNMSLWQAERYSASIDAAVALAERVLPGWKVCLTWGFKKPTAMLWRKQEPSIDGVADIMPLALCAAILRAKIAELETQP